jgi:putative oxidoreductase
MTTTLELFKTNMHLSAFWAYLSSYTEFIGGFLIMIGLLTRFASIALLINMLVATLLVGFKNFFLGGAAYPCLLFVICLVLILTGPMAYSIDSVLSNKNEKHRTT